MTRRCKLDIENYVNELAEMMTPETQPIAEHTPASLESVLKGLAVELWSDTAGRLFIVADDEDAGRLGQPRGIVYTAPEVRRILRIGDPDVVSEIHEWKQKFDGRIRESGA